MEFTTSSSAIEHFFLSCTRTRMHVHTDPQSCQWFYIATGGDNAPASNHGVNNAKKTKMALHIFYEEGNAIKMFVRPLEHSAFC